MNNLKNEISELILLCGSIENEEVKDLISGLKEEHFTSNENKEIFNNISNMILANNDINLITLNSQKWSNRKHVMNLISGILEDLTLALDYKLLAKEIIDYKIKRQILEQLTLIAKEVSNVSVDELEDKLSKLENEIRTQSMSEYETYEELLERAEKDFHTPNVDKKTYKTGLNNLDELIKIRNGNTYVIGAKTGFGKSSFVQALSIELAKKGLKGHIFSLEMSAIDMLKKQISNITKIPFEMLDTDKKYRDKIVNEQGAKAYEFLKRKEQVLHINDNFDLHISDIKRQSRELKKNNNLDFLVVDQISLIRNEHRDERMKLKETSWQLRKLAKELDIPIFVLTQLNRGAELGTPTLDNIAESSAVAFDTSAIMLLDGEREENTIKVHVVKNRFGKCETIAFTKNWDICTIKESELL